MIDFFCFDFGKGGKIQTLQKHFKSKLTEIFCHLPRAENLNPKTVRLVVKLKLKTTGFLREVGSSLSPLFQESRFAVERRRILKETAS